ncbi:13865_t:CDS:2 [Cetraspora pellucida]|uniref:13865_t:CDS:1 n=1 Tax=Cetraspora pellucida TaxID=1433469 RepID=A0ACA9MDZ0_9GLOM|nr:13865_t:CDS:2 [Cetraspora pellucida]
MNDITSFGSKTKTTLGKDGYSFNAGWFANLGKKEKENIDKSVEELREFKEKGKVDERAISLTTRIAEDYRSLVEKQQNFLLQGREEKQKDIDILVNGSISVLKWEEIPKIQKLKEEIVDKILKCDRCEGCNKKKI